MGYFETYLGKEFRQVFRLEEKIQEAHKDAGLTLIGTCGDCEFWEDDNTHWSALRCNHKIGERLFVSMHGIKAPPKDYGCIYFKEKP